MILRVDAIFGVASLEDAGRPGYRQFGVPIGGAFDQLSMKLANALLDQKWDCPVLEFSGRLTCTAITDGWLAIAGAVGVFESHGYRESQQVRFHLKKGEIATFSEPTLGIRSYLACPGGWQATQTLGSVSGTIVKNMMSIQSKTDRSFQKKLSLASPSSTLVSAPFHFIGAPGFECGNFFVTPQINRIGLRCRGPAPRLPDLESSEPAIPGVIQSPDGEEILVHGVDGPTLGGYGRLGCILAHEVCRLGQLRPGDELRLARVEYTEAVHLEHEAEFTLKRLLADIKISVGTA